MNANSGRPRSPLLRAPRNWLRELFFRFIRHIAALGDSRDILNSMLREQNVACIPREGKGSWDVAYPELAPREETRPTSQRSDIVFITGRFRSGSTLLWNVFRHIDGVTSYYEPFNERRWFDPSRRGDRVDATHLDVSEYWSEYEGLEALAEHYHESWTCRRLYMDAHAWNPSMQRYIEIMVERARGRPVLQFNRVDLRLPWLRARFPNAKVLHIVRHPRDQWCSSLPTPVRDGRSLTLRDFQTLDGFYLLSWGRDLANYFPFLSVHPDAHPYELFYQIWRLSYLFGRRYADLSVRLEDLLESPRVVIAEVLRAVSIDARESKRLEALVKPVRVKRWHSFADDEWFEAIERRVHIAFVDYFREAAALDEPASRHSPLTEGAKTRADDDRFRVVGRLA